MRLKFTPPLDWRSTLTYLSPRAIRSDVVFDYDQRTSAEDLVSVLQSLSGSASTPHDRTSHGAGRVEWKP
jgi:hypothetical protein